MVIGDHRPIQAMVPISRANTGMEIDSPFMLRVLPHKKPGNQLSAGMYRKDRHGLCL
jgi:hypothetical protein